MGGPQPFSCICIRGTVDRPSAMTRNCLVVEWMVNLSVYWSLNALVPDEDERRGRVSRRMDSTSTGQLNTNSAITSLGEVS
mmetsp:Transcript_13447/g.22062  ORF Transcript_13447/g.22062 Transcript_13447/m.22062 type:complete len:81 (-) Transcript_13447:13-255(-)